MYKEELVDKMRGIKALLYMASTTTDQIEDQEYAFALLGDHSARMHRRVGKEPGRDVELNALLVTN